MLQANLRSGQGSSSRKWATRSVEHAALLREVIDEIGTGTQQVVVGQSEQAQIVDTLLYVAKKC